MTGRRWVRVIAAAFVILMVVGLVGYSAYVGAVGSSALTDPTRRAQCSIPATQFGWPYEAINYDLADDDHLIAANPDLDDCSDQGADAGDSVVTDDGVPIAGWYIPAADGGGPTAPTIILVHGWNANKSEVLRYGAPLHERFNLVAMDLRHGGRSGGDAVTFGVHEQADVRAVVDWVERTKHPTSIGLVGNSMGGATAAAEALRDPRIGAVLLDSTHAAALSAIGRRLSEEEGQPAWPGSWAIALGVWARTGVDIRSVDPVDVVPRLGDRPVLLIHGTDDPIDVPAESAERTLAAARGAGIDIDLRYCEGGRHGDLIDHCPDEWGIWANDFFERNLSG
jgi:pimeloyl-ACP methyl ester carboxylesterase